MGARVSTWFIDIRRRFRENANSGDSTEKSLGLKNARIDLKLSGRGKFGVGMTNSLSQLPNSGLAQSYSDPHYS